MIHGQRDEVIPFEHGKRLVIAYENIQRRKCDFNQPSSMTHNNFDLYEDIIVPL